MADEVPQLRSLDEVEAMRETLAVLQQEPPLSAADEQQLLGATRAVYWMLGLPDPAG